MCPPVPGDAGRPTLPTLSAVLRVKIWAISLVLQREVMPLNKYARSQAVTGALWQAGIPPAGFSGSENPSGGKKKITWFAFFNSEIQKEATSLPPKNWKFHLNWCWVFIDFLCVLPLNIGTVVRLVFSFCVFFTKTEFGEWRLITGIKTYFVWPITYPWNRHDKIWSPSPPTEGRPLWRLHTSARRAPAHSPRVFIGSKRKHQLFTPPLCCLLPAPRRFPLKLWCWESQAPLCPCPSQRGPHPFGFSIFLIMWKSTVCHHRPCDSPTRLSPPDLSYGLSNLFCNSGQAVME